MKCDNCQIQEASLQVTSTTNGQTQHHQLCPSCAEKLGIDVGVRPSHMTGFPGFNTPHQPAEQVNILDAFSDRAKAVIQSAAQVATQAGSPALDTEHILIGIAGESDVAQPILDNLDIKADELAGYLQENMVKGQRDYADGVSPDLAPRAKRALELAWHAARDLQHDYVGSEHILIGLLAEDEGLAAQTLKKYGLTDTKLRQAVLSAVGAKGKPKGAAKTQSKTPTLDKYSRNLNELAAANKLDPVIGRTEEVQRVVQILSRRTKNNPVLIGEPGTGKTAIVEGLAARIVNKEVPESLLGKQVVALDIASLVAGTKYRGEFEERINNVVKEITDANGQIILFLDELHSLVGAGNSGDGSTLDAANILKPALARGDLQVVGATTLREYKKYIEPDGALERRFQPIQVKEPSLPDAIQILRGLKDRYEAHHKVAFQDAALVASVNLANKYIRDRFLPDKAIDLMDEAAARVRLDSLAKPADLDNEKKQLISLNKELAAAEGPAHAGAKTAKQTAKITELNSHIKAVNQAIKKSEAAWQAKHATAQPQVTVRDIEAIVASWTGIPVAKLTEQEATKLLDLEKELHQRVIAQDEAVSAVSAAIRRNRAGLKDPTRPQGVFLFLGPTGVGKTELSKALADLLFGRPDALIRLDMSEYMEPHSVARMIGSPPGYIGHEEGGQLTESIRRQPYSVILLDEIEKAHPDVMNILLQVFEDGHLTDGQGRQVDFKHTLIIMTSNIGSDMPAELIPDKLTMTFRPEFLNRIDDIITFHTLTKPQVQLIADLMLTEVVDKVAAQGLKLTINEEVRNRLAQDGFDTKYGARPLRRAIQQRLENQLATALLSGQFKRGTKIEAYLQADDIAFRKIKVGGKVAVHAATEGAIRP